jgi:acetamidase/formamidase
MTEPRIVHTVTSRAVHYEWDNSLEPLLTVGSGETVSFEVRGGADHYYSPESTGDDVRRRPKDRGMPLTGPVQIEGATPGDVLQVDIVSVVPDSWGYTTIEPGVGLLADEFKEPYFKSWDLSDRVAAEFDDGIRIPIAPFLGVIGVAPEAPGRHDVRPPGRQGGNLDVKHLTSGSTLWLPVGVRGALVSVGDAHAAQGDGEVCNTAIETGAVATLRFSIVRRPEISAPAFRSSGPLDSLVNTGPWYCTLGIESELMGAARSAVRALIAYLEKSRRLSAEEAYVLCSVAADLRINEIVDAPNWVVSACLPLSIFFDREPPPEGRERKAS